MKNLKDIRIRKGLTQDDLSGATGIHQPRISLYEHGLPVPDRDKTKILKALGLAENETSD